MLKPDSVCGSSSQQNLKSVWIIFGNNLGILGIIAGLRPSYLQMNTSVNHFSSWDWKYNFFKIKDVKCPISIRFVEFLFGEMQIYSRRVFSISRIFNIRWFFNGFIKKLQVYISKEWHFLINMYILKCEKMPNSCIINEIKKEYFKKSKYHNKTILYYSQ